MWGMLLRLHYILFEDATGSFIFSPVKPTERVFSIQIKHKENITEKCTTFNLIEIKKNSDYWLSNKAAN